MRRIMLILLTFFVLLLCSCSNTTPSTTPSTTPTTQDVQETTAPPPPETSRPQPTAPTLSAHDQYADILLAEGQDRAFILQSSMTCLYDDPRELDLYYLFYGGVLVEGGWHTIPETEREYLVEQGLLGITDLQILPVERLEQLLWECFNITLEDIEKGIPEEWVYYDVTDSYYTSHGDTYINSFTITAAEETEDGLLKLYYSTPDRVISKEGEFIYGRDLVLTLRLAEDGNYQAISNQLLP